MSLTPSPAAPRPRRRSLLTGALGATSVSLALPLVGGCTDAADGSTDAEDAGSSRRLRESAARDSEHLLARYEGTARVHPATAGRLRPLRDEVARHVRVLRGSESGSPSPAPSGSRSTRSPSASPSSSQGPRGRQSDGPTDRSPTAKPPSPDTASVPKDKKAALTALADAEHKLAAARTKALAGSPPELARLLASLAACGSAHGYLLDHGRDESGSDADKGIEGGKADNADNSGKGATE